ncbi:hypothetical protein N7481_009680 [Penicillium waksmanii]|uniref:uncharacterized protein n=1 Tax=Penicillium waksmanii TaxID=69791 RepID=UPI0025466C84|nr:uncharacterized protein N7481_009680 [Penicillium waksmanii]KAJ5975973.1 hypothetical protein N7481_009680 [Penicillium waksmanii]
MRFLPTFLSLVAVSTAAPTNFFDDAYDFSEGLLDYYSKVSQHINRLRHSKTPVGCDASKITLPSYASGLKAPDGLSPMYVAIGRGTQNYTCADSTSKSTPAAAGAVANLYNATCMAANFPDLLELIPNLIWNSSVPLDVSAFPRAKIQLPANVDLMGHHFFYDSTTPEFNLNIAGGGQFGIAMTKKGGSIDAPSTATKGTYGAVAWLYLTTTTGTVGKYKAVYRVDTASGSPPDTCLGQPAQFQMKYSANYYFFGN